MKRFFLKNSWSVFIYSPILPLIWLLNNNADFFFGLGQAAESSVRLICFLWLAETLSLPLGFLSETDLYMNFFTGGA